MVILDGMSSSWNFEIISYKIMGDYFGTMKK